MVVHANNSSTQEDLKFKPGLPKLCKREKEREFRTDISKGWKPPAKTTFAPGKKASICSP
jgi:hypothetical protein